MQSRFHPMFYVVLPLAVLGFAYQFNQILYSMVIPITIIAVLFILYFVMQKRRNNPRISRHSSTARGPKPQKLKTKRNSSPFRVIEGRKKRDDEPPRYH